MHSILTTVSTPVMQIHILTIALGLLALAFHVTAHTFLLEPTPFNRQYTTVTCDNNDCGLACPKYIAGSAENTPKSPEATWGRGQRVNVTWARNNHHGGFISFMLVPMDSALSTIMDTALHDSLAFNHGCWEQGNFICAPGYYCGSAKNGNAFSRIITVPPVYPDGIYIFSTVWYGGLHFERRYGHFPDYRSCVFVRIQGGLPTVRKFNPFFDPGRNERKVQGDWCESAASAPGVCPYTGCRGPEYPMFTGKPLIFANGAQPPPIYRRTLERLFLGSNPSPNPTKSPYPSTTSTATASPSRLPLPPPTSPPSPVVSASPIYPHSSPLTAPSSKTQVPGGICVIYKQFHVCCHESCTTCKQNGCKSRPGGARQCCPKIITRKPRPCDSNGPPCVIRFWQCPCCEVDNWTLTHEPFLSQRKALDGYYQRCSRHALFSVFRIASISICLDASAL